MSKNRRPIKQKFSTGEYTIDLESWFDGQCISPSIPEEQFTIWIRPNIRGKARLETIVHEATHAQFPGLSEDVVDSFAKSMSQLLWKLGYRGDR